ncbi:hypothetical protein HN681_04670 [archaeon]|jgi:hypothetical protein|nr:hypothetical protein [archaeon]MBT3731001.1 hypothetical protein [archaeon]MBT4669761.1 hypothetical protein [archaeon]MBT5029911.1 hypothetical protein [archaeon]MBT5288483.1 hypothetical protein [archaeon]
MVTADEALGEIKDLCNMFGFDFSRHFMAENIKREISFMISNLCVNTLCSALKKGWIFRKDICFNLEDKKSIEYLSNRVRKYFNKLEGGGGFFEWYDEHDKLELKYKLMNSMTLEQAKKVFLYPESISEQEVISAFPKWVSDAFYHDFINIVKNIAIISYLCPEFKQIVEEARKVAIAHSKKDTKVLPWIWYGNLTSDQHAGLIHESLHNILTNSGVDDRSIKAKDAYSEGIAVFFHRKSGLFLGYYQKGLFSDKMIKKYWDSSEIFWQEFEDIQRDKFFTIPTRLKNKNDEKTRKIIDRLNNQFSGSFHADFVN